MKAFFPAGVFVLLAGCSTALQREGQCLASLTDEFLHAQEELTRLEASWRAALSTHQGDLPAPTADRSADPDARKDGRFAMAPGSDGPGNDGWEHRWPGRQAAQEAYTRFTEARIRHRPLLSWYDRVYERVRTRLEEEEILSEVRMVLMPGPGLIFYPIVRWNVHSVFWDGVDPDAGTDPVTSYCTERLSSKGSPTEPTVQKTQDATREKDGTNSGGGTSLQEEERDVSYFGAQPK